MRSARLAIQLVAGGMLLPALWAHHGSEFIALDDYEVGHPGDGLVKSGFDLERFDGEDELSVESGLFISPLPRVGVGLDLRITEDGRGDWVYSSVSPRVQLQLTDPHADGPFKVGLSLGYQFAEDLSYDETTTSFEDIVIQTPTVVRQVEVEVPDVEPPDGGEPDCDPLLDLDCVPASPVPGPKHAGSHDPVVTTKTTTVTSGGESETQRVATTTTTRKGVSSHQGIHDHDSRQWFGRLIVETYIGETKLVGNLVSTLPEDDHAYWGYGFGVRRPLVGTLAGALEVIGDLQVDGEHEAIASLDYGIGSHATARLGIGFGLTDESPDVTMRTGLIWRF